MKTILATLAIVLACGPAMARTYKPMNVNKQNFRSVKVAQRGELTYSALASKSGGTRSLFLVRSGGFVAETAYSRVNLNRAYKEMKIDYKSFKSTSISSGLMNPDLPRLTLLTAKDGSGTAFIERSGGFTRNPQAMFSKLKL